MFPVGAVARAEVILRIFNRSTLKLFWTKHADAEQALRAWHQEVEGASWQGPVDIRARYASASIVGSRVVFDIRGNRYRLVVDVKYAPFFCVYVRFMGTHAEYDKIDVLTV